MNRIAAIALFSVVVLMTAGRATAQSHSIEVKVPFTFIVNNTSLPPGSYFIDFDRMHPEVLMLRDRTHSVKAQDLGLRGSIGTGRPNTLMFHRYGSQYFLSEVRLGSASDGIYFPRTKLERQAGKVGAREEVALVAPH
jgi:hypothetical protein